jgi:tRNA A-37 threonylcarbamoyl transferase component Bud32
MAIDEAFKTQPFPEAVEFLRQKITLGTDSWRDIAGDENDAFFVVAGAKGSLLAEVRSITEQAITEGWRPEQFRERFDQVAAGWDGANPWRADLIYRTNVRQSYARGREEYQFDPDVLSVFPYLKYQHSDALQPRPLHKALDGKIFPAQEIPWTNPCGYNCGCKYTSATEDEAKAQGISTIRRGQTIPTEAGPLPVEPDEGFDRTPGMAKGEERDRIIQRVIDRSPPTIAAQIAAAIAGYVPPPTPPLEPPTPEQLAEQLTQEPVTPYKRNRLRQLIDGATSAVRRAIQMITGDDVSLAEIEVEELARLIIASIFEEGDLGRILSIDSVLPGTPAEGWTVMFTGETDGKTAERFIAIYDGNEITYDDDPTRYPASLSEVDFAAKRKSRKGKKPKKKCVKGKPCGGTCIARFNRDGSPRQCRIQPAGAVKGAADALAKAKPTPGEPVKPTPRPVPPERLTESEIPGLAQVVQMREVGAGANGAVVVNDAGTIAYKYLKSGGFVGDEEVETMRVASDLGVAPKFLGAKNNTQIIAMEFLPDYKPLGDKGALSSLNPEMQKNVARNVVRQTEKLHNAGITHADLHTDNVLFDPKNGEVRIIDFGLAGIDKYDIGRVEDFEVLIETASWGGGIPILGSSAIKKVVAQYDSETADPKDIYNDLIEAIDKL